MSLLMFDRWRPRALLLLEDGLWDGTQRHASFEAWCAAHPGQACTLWLSSALLLELVCEPGLPIADDTAALGWARGLLQHYHGEAAGTWPLAAWQQGRRRGVSALHGVSLDTLRSTASQAKVRLRGVRPWWALVLWQALRQHPTLRAGMARLLVVEGARVAVIGLDAGQLCSLQLRRLDAALPVALRRWCAESEAMPTVAVGYGLAAGAIDGIEAPDALDGVLPAPRWLASAYA